MTTTTRRKPRRLTPTEVDRLRSAVESAISAGQSEVRVILQAERIGFVAVTATRPEWVRLGT